MQWAAGWAVLLCLCCPFAGRAADPPQTPFLRIEAGGHTGSVAHLATDRAGRLLASAGFDKTIRVWSLPEGRQIEVLRPPIGNDHEGEIYAVAMTPDGKRVFAAGATGGSWDSTFSIYIFDVAKGTLLGSLPGLASPVEALAMAPDGSRFAAGLAHGGIAVWWALSGKRIFGDAAYGGPVRAVAFDKTGRLYSSCADGKLRVYTPDGHLAASAAVPGLGHPWGIALSPDESLLAVADAAADKAGHLHVSVLSTRTLAPAFVPDTTGLQGEGLLSVAWAAGAGGSVQLLAGGYARGKAGYVIRRWADFGLGPPADVPAASDSILHILPLPGGGAAYATEDPGWGILTADGQAGRLPIPAMADLRPARDLLTVSQDGQTVAFKTRSATFRFDAATPDLTASATPDTVLVGARTAAPGMTLTGWRDSNAPRLNGIRLGLDAAEFARSAAILPDNSGIMLGTDTHLRLYSRDGRLRATVPIDAAAWAIAVSGDGKVAVAAELDGTLRWYGLAQAENLAERAALFADPAGGKWVLFTPEGFFDDGAKGGNDLVGLLLNRARNQQPVWMSFSQAYRALYAPAVVRARLHGDPAPAKARLAGLGDLRTRIGQQPLASVSQTCLLGATGDCAPVTADAKLRTGDRLRLHVSVRDRGLGVGPIDEFVNGRIVGRIPPPQLSAGAGEADAMLPLDPDRNLVQLRVYDASASIFSETPLLSLGGTGAAAAAHTLHVLVVGINRFALPSAALHYAVADADSFTGIIRAAATPLFSSVQITELRDEQATRAGILAALGKLADTVRPDDTFVFYVASHGTRSHGSGRFLLVPQDIGSVATWDAIEAASIDETTLIAGLARIQARNALLLLDTCYSGEVTADSLANLSHETGRYLLASARSDQEALDSYDNRNGVMIYAIREALNGRAAHDDSGTITALSLGEYVSHRVGELAREKGGNQDAVFRTAQRELTSFPLGQAVHAAPQ